MFQRKGVNKGVQVLSGSDRQVLVVTVTPVNYWKQLEHFYSSWFSLYTSVSFLYKKNQHFVSLDDYKREVQK